MIVIDAPVGSIPQSIHSHKAAHAYLRAMQHGPDVRVATGLEDSWSDATEIWLYHGMEFQGAMNLPGGLNEEIERKLLRLVNTVEGGVKLKSLDIPCPNYGALMAKRKDRKLIMDRDCERMTNLFVSSPSESAWPLAKIPIVTDKKDADHDTFVVGDSHALSMGSLERRVARLDFKTLNGAVNSDVIEVAIQNLLDKGETAFRRLVLYFGNIDIRHHLCRLFRNQARLRDEIKRLVSVYAQKAQVLQDEYGCDVTFVAPLPIEDESRVLPKTGYHEGKPFHGSWEERNNARIWMTHDLEREAAERGMKLYEHPSFYFDTSKPRRELSFDVMEKPRSVHLSRAAYPTDFLNGRINERLTEEEGTAVRNDLW